jgi:hypothetical protein
MGMPAIFRVLWVGLLAAACISVAIPAHGKTAQQKQAEEAAKRRPMTFFLAKGGPNACGQGCSEWIAADGVFDTDSAKRFVAFLAALKRDDLPVFFNSPGGSVSQSVLIGAQLRQRRMTVGIGRTRPDGCARDAHVDACHRVMQSKAEHKARLTVEGARCFSACTYAFVGGSIRNVGKGAKLGVHSAFPRVGVPDRAGVVDQTHDLLRRYAIEMGIDSGLIDLAAATKSVRMHTLTRAEISRFGVETTPFYETRWLAFQHGDKTFNLIKSVTRGNGAGDKQGYSATIHVACASSFGVLLRYRRELQPDFKFRPAVSFRVESDSVSLGSGVEQASIGLWSTVATFRMLEQAAERNKIEIVENYAAAANRDAQTTSISTNGLSEALTVLRKRCTERKLSAVHS